MNSSPRYRIRLRRSEKLRTASVALTVVLIESDSHIPFPPGSRFPSRLSWPIGATAATSATTGH
jgi:hypothetical protein